MKLHLTILLLTICSCFISTSQSQENPILGLKVGNLAPDMKFASPLGKEISLYDLKGKMVLIDFWASWCSPCRMENPSLVKAYETYKDENFNNGKGFTIYSVSLDQNKDKWINTIETDKLVWEYHVSDLLGWNSKAAFDYRVRSIPQNYLIDGNGIILAINLRGKQLEEKLQSLLKTDPLDDVKNEIQELLRKIETLKNASDYHKNEKEIEKIYQKVLLLEQEISKIKANK